MSDEAKLALIDDRPKAAFWDALRRELLSSDEATDPVGRWIRRARSGLLILALAWVSYRLATFALRRAERRMRQQAEGASPAQARKQQQVATVLGLGRSIVWYVVALATAILLLDNAFGLNVWPLVTGAGIVGVAIAFGSQALVRDTVTGFFQLMEGQYAVGDFVQIGGIAGRVEEVGLRVTRLRDLQGRLHYLPNGSITTVTNYDAAVEEYMLQAPFADAAEADAAQEAIVLLAAGLRREYPELIVSLGEPALAPAESGLHAVRLEIGLLPTQGWVATEEAPARVKQLFADRGIAVPEARPPRSYQRVSPQGLTPEGGR